MNLFGFVPMAIGVALILGAKKITEWNLAYLRRELNKAEQKAKSGRWDSIFGAFQAGVLRWQISGWEGFAGAPTLILIGIGAVSMGIFALLPGR
jgi:hypothetical protein